MKVDRSCSFFKHTAVTLMISALLLLGACATMDVASMESAEAIDGGKVKMLLATGNGFNLNHRTGQSHNAGADFGYTLSPNVCMGGLSVGLGGTTELGGRIHLLSHTWGIKATLKKQIYETPTGYSMALLVGGTATSFEGPPSLGGLGGKADDTHYWSDPYDSYGTEMQVIGSKRWSRLLISSLILKGNSTMRKAGVNERIYHGGIRTNLIYGTQKLNMIPEIGMDFYLDPQDKPVWTPRLAFGISIR